MKEGNVKEQELNEVETTGGLLLHTTRLFVVHKKQS